MASERITTAAGAIVWRNNPRKPGQEVATIHRPSYDDWSFPKGKTDSGEALQTTAVREIAEETGLRVRLGHPLPGLSYPISGGLKTVAYWCARATGQEEATPFVPNKEVDDVRWVGLGEAEKLLTYEHDRELLEAFRTLSGVQAHRSRTLIVLRHAKAVARSAFEGEDLDRPLTSVGAAQAKALVPLLAAYGVRRVVSSPAVRCTQTVEPYARSIGMFLEIDDRLSEETRAGQVQRSVEALLDRKKPVVLCTHRPTLPWVFDAIGSDVHALAPGDALVVHHRRGTVLATEKLA
jgi:phosphohistidine phosphatase SixA/8-oxo-dGTP pyrophosphatase MutT (NUDIX family)